jgi:hypothetical protein
MELWTKGREEEREREREKEVERGRMEGRRERGRGGREERKEKEGEQKIPCCRPLKVSWGEMHRHQINVSVVVCFLSYDTIKKGLNWVFCRFPDLKQ